MNTFQTRNIQPLTGKTFLLVAAAVFCLCTAARTFAVNFTGDWKLNEAKSELGQNGGRGAARLLRVTSSDATAIAIERTSTNQNGESNTRKEALTFDGKEAESVGGFNNAKRKASAKWSDDGQSMLINATTIFERDGQPIEIKQKEMWKLADGGQTLLIESNSSSSFGESTMKLVYEKAK